MQRQRSMLAVFVVLLLGPVVPSQAASDIEPLVSADWLKTALDRNDLTVIDIRGRSADEAFEVGHVPGAVWSRYPGGWRGDGNIPGAAPSAAQLEVQLSGLGVSNDTAVVIVSSGASSSDFGGAARVYWSFKYAGHDQVAILDGGWAGWIASGDNPVETGPTTPTPAAYSVTLRPELLATTESVRASLGKTTLIDARPGEQFVGETKSAAAARAGHIPGATNINNATFFDPASHRLAEPEALQSLLPASLADHHTDIVTYCNGGHWSATNWFVLHELLGYSETSLYADSMIGWTQNPDNPVATTAN